ncbi:DUF6240 domain-containing protein [Aneurinibacillus thermoaerophilus]|uniref:Hook-length control protein FliK n=1 Tax=Aneurinibacillus thermoaerophilus TaxID=143495 RepID=A0ABX8Y9X8_ANETH|nr:DUF6240 domain-containing protein [Aneurinibacillus thermoaerophilus]QYY42496.1 hypothetical protein K3F53_16900 [Aneurinibacillus thermoaerophilus]
MQVSDVTRSIHTSQMSGKTTEPQQGQMTNHVNGQGSVSLSSETTAEQVLQDAGIKATVEMKEAVRLLIAERIPVTKETLQSLQHILQKGEGTIQQKLDTLSIMAQKKISVTPRSYEAVFRALYGPSLDQILSELAKEAPDLLPELRFLSNSDSLQDAHRSVPDHSRAGMSALLEQALQKLAEQALAIRMSGRATRSQLRELQEAVAQAVQEARLSTEVRKDLESAIRQIMKELRMSLSYEAVGRHAEAKIMVERSIDMLVKMLKLPVVGTGGARTESGSPNMSFPDGEGVDHSGANVLRPLSETFIRLGNLVSLARQELLVALGNIQMEGSTSSRQPDIVMRDLAVALRDAIKREGVPQKEANQAAHILQQLEEAARQPAQNGERLLAGMDELERLFAASGERMAALTAVQTATFERLTRYIPDYLHQVGEKFRQTKKEIINNVERMSQFLRQNIPQAASYIQRIVEPTIEMVNRLVNKGEFALFADMDFEYELLRMSGELQRVKGLLAKGEQDEALRLFQRLRTDLEKLNWQPSYTKVERFFSKMTGEGGMQNPLQLYAQQWREESLTGRGVQEAMRGMGFSHEREAVEWMMRREGDMRSAGYNSSDARGEKPPHNLKAMLMNGMESHASPKAREMLEQALSHVTGQQLLSKQEAGTVTQSFQVQLPLPWEEGMHSVHMQVRARQNGEQMDWENCSLFFFLDTPKFGETGVAVTVVEREMAIRVQNDHPFVEQAFAPYIPRMKEELQRMGYRVQSVTFSPLAHQERESEQRKAPAIDTATGRQHAFAHTSGEGVDISV